MLPFPLIKYSIVLFLIIFFAACDENQQASKNDCTYGTPSAIFKETTPSVTQHSFKLVNNEGVERVVFESGTVLDIIQSGCDEIEQELRFRLKNKKIPTDDELFGLGIRNLNDMGKLSMELSPFSAWAKAIYDNHTKLKKGLEIELEPTTYASIDKIEESEDTIIRIVLAKR